MIVSPRKIIREDGTHLAVFTATEFKTEFKGCVELLKDWYVLHPRYREEQILIGCTGGLLLLLSR
jgi:hypothetical protein